MYFKTSSIFLLLDVAIATMSQPNTTTTTTNLPPFTLSAPPGTDIWRKPPSHNAFNAPTHPSTLPTYPIASFQRARLTFTLPAASQLRQYDQAGILLHLTKPGVPDNQTKWIKSGIEFYYGKPYVATVGCDIWADWSLTPAPSNADANDTRPTATIEARRERDDLGKSLWVYAVEKDADGKEERRPLREVNWFFAEEEGWEVGVGAYVARPTKEGGEEVLEAVFGEGVEIEILDG
jgi:regulation of enolase protein 1 (concanavalin A-like superfamily)